MFSSITPPAIIVINFYFMVSLDLRCVRACVCLCACVSTHPCVYMCTHSRACVRGCTGEWVSVWVCEWVASNRPNCSLVFDGFTLYRASQILLLVRDTAVIVMVPVFKCKYSDVLLLVSEGV